MSIEIDFGFAKTYTTTITRTVGATTRTGVRGTLPQAAPDDLNSIWIAPNGNDGNAGTQAAPVLTVPIAKGKLGGAFTNIQFFRNSYVGELNWTLSATLALATGETMQVEDGEIANLYFTSGGHIEITGIVKLNGLNLAFDGSWDIVIWVKNNANLTIENCNIIAPSSGTSTRTWGVYAPSSSTSGTFTARYNYISAWTALAFVAEKQPVITNNILIENRGTYTGTVTETTGIRVESYSFAGAVATTDFENNLVIGFSSGLSIIMSANHPLSPGNTLNVNGCHFEKCDYLISTNYWDEIANRQYGIINIDYTLDHSFDLIDYTVASALTLPVDLIITITNPIPDGTPLMFVDKKTAFDETSESPESARLQMVGKATIDGTDRYYIDSPLVGILTGPADLSPFIESTALTSEAFNDTISLDWPAKSLQVTNDLKNPVNIIDIKGNPHTAYDARRRRFILTWGDGVHISNRQMKELFFMISDTGSKKFYPLGAAANIYTPGNLTAGTFSDTDDSITVTEAAANNMVDDHWRGFWVTIGSDDYYIESNDATKLYLVDKLSAGFPANGAVNFIVSYILVKTPAEAYNISQTNFTEFLKGGAWRENDTDVQNYDLTISAINFDEVEDREEGVE